MHLVKPISKTRTLTDMIAEGTRDFSPMYSAWFGKPVVLLVVVRQCHVPMPCKIVGESAAGVRVRIHPGWEMDVRKELILAVEEDAVATASRMN
jgi:hypothetical protein